MGHALVTCDSVQCPTLNPAGKCLTTGRAPHLVGRGFGPSSSDGKLNEEASRYTSCPRPPRPPGAQGLSRQPVDLAIVCASLSLPHGNHGARPARTSQLHHLNPLGPRVLSRSGSVHKCSRCLQRVSAVPDSCRDCGAPPLRGSVHLVLVTAPWYRNPRLRSSRGGLPGGSDPACLTHAS